MEVGKEVKRPSKSYPGDGEGTKVTAIRLSPRCANPTPSGGQGACPGVAETWSLCV